MMNALVLHGFQDYRYESVEKPIPGPNELLVKVEAVGICASDGKVFTGAEKYWGGNLPKNLPVIPGHEFSGIVVEAGQGGENHHGVQIGDLVVAEQILSCGKCRFCKDDNYQGCVDGKVFGFNKLHQGAMAEYMIYPANAKVHRVPGSVDPFKAAFIEPLACSVHAVNLAMIEFSDVVVIAGCGPIGLGIIAAAKQKSPKTIIALDMFDWKLEIAKKCGADIVLNPSRVRDLEEQIKLLSGGYGCDVYFEVTGNPKSVQQGLNLLRFQGRFICMSVFKGNVEADWSLIGDVKELKIIGSHLGPGCWPKAIDMVAKEQLPLDDIITHKFPLTDFHKGIEMVVKSSTSIKVMLHF